MEQLAGRKEVQFDWAKFTWIGSPERTEEVLFIRSDSPYKNIDDLRKIAEALALRRHRHRLGGSLFP